MGLNSGALELTACAVLMNIIALYFCLFCPTSHLCVCVYVCCFKERMETANKQLAAKECDDTEENRKTVSQLLAQSEDNTHKLPHKVSNSFHLLP